MAELKTKRADQSLDDVERPELRKLVKLSVQHMKRTHPD
jgi:hypothetical protein